MNSEITSTSDLAGFSGGGVRLVWGCRVRGEDAGWLILDSAHRPERRWVDWVGRQTVSSLAVQAPVSEICLGVPYLASMSYFAGLPSGDCRLRSQKSGSMGVAGSKAFLGNMRENFCNTEPWLQLEDVFLATRSAPASTPLP